MPFLTLGGLYRTSANDSSILWMAALNIWLSLVSGVLGSFSACAVGYAKIFLHDLIFSGLGVIIYL